MHHSPLVIAGGVTIALFSGSLTSLQTRINSQLSSELGDPFVTALISFGTGLVILIAILAVSRSGRNGIVRLRLALRQGEIPWYFLIGGAFGAVFVTGQGLTAAVVGVALYTTAVVAAQTVSGAIIDRVGLGDLPQRPVTVLRAVASVLAVVAALVAGLAELRGDVSIGLLLLPLFAGAGIGYQQAVNGQVRHISQSVLTATFLNFLSGTVVVFLIAVIHTASAGWVAQFPSQPWLYAGGLLGVLFTAGAAIVVRTIGVLLLGLGTVGGQLLGSLVLDLVIPIQGRDLTITTVIGTIVTLVAVAIAAYSARAPFRR